MKLIQGWKIRLLASLAIATASGQVDAQTMPVSPSPNAKSTYLTSHSGAPVANGSYDASATVADVACDAPGADCDSCGPDGSCDAPGHGRSGGLLGNRSGGILGGGLLGGGNSNPYGGHAMGMDFDYGAQAGSYGGYSGGYGPGGFGPGGMGPGGFGPGGMGGECGPDCGPGCNGQGCGGRGLLGRGFGNERQDRFGRSYTGFRHDIQGWFSSKRGILRPYGEGGVANQRWFDLSAEAVFLSRTKGSSDYVFSRDGIGGPAVLTSDMVDLDAIQAGLGVQLNVATGPGSNLEFVYFGLNNWNESAEANVNPATPTLYSFISGFGTLPYDGYDDSDRSYVQRIDYKSELHNGEINLRRRWAEPQGFWQGSFLGGVRYMDIDESARFTARGVDNNTASDNGPRYFDYNVNTRNALVGFQLGADLWYNVMPGIKLGGEVKSGIFNNSTNQDSRIFANSLPGFGIPEITEYAKDDNTAYITQLSAQLWYRLNYSWAFRTSYQWMYVDGVSLATENFNATPPSIFLPTSDRVVTLNNDAEIIYQGFTFGAEYMW